MQDLDLRKLQQRVLNLSTNNVMLRTKGTGRYQFDLASTCLDINDISKWINNRFDDNKLKLTEYSIQLEISKRLADIQLEKSVIQKKEDIDTEDSIRLSKLEDEEKILKRKVKTLFKKLQNIAKRSVEIRKQTGKYTLYAGVFFVNISLGGAKVINAPLLLYPISINSTIKSIEIQHNVDRQIVINSTLLLALKKYFGFNAKTKALDADNIDEITSDLVHYSNILTGVDDLKDSIACDGKLALSAIKLKGTDTCEIYLGITLGIYDTSSAIYKDYTNMVGCNNLINTLINGSSTELTSYASAVKEKYTEPKWRTTELNLITQLDSSQEQAVYMADKSSNLVIYGPPGTGKSQVIVNIICDQASKGKRILVTSQKLTALEVVYKRLGKLRHNTLYIEDSGQRLSFRKQLEQRVQSFRFISKERLISDKEKYSSDIDLQLSRLDTLYDRLSDNVGNTGVTRSYLYKHGAVTEDTQLKAVDIIYQLSDLFDSLTIKELTELCNRVSTQNVIDAYNSCDWNRIDSELLKLSKLQLLRYRKLVTEKISIQNEQNIVSADLSKLGTNTDIIYDSHLDCINTLLSWMGSNLNLKYIVGNQDDVSESNELYDEMAKTIEVVGQLDLTTDTIVYNGQTLHKYDKENAVESIQSRLDCIIETKDVIINQYGQQDNNQPIKTQIQFSDVTISALYDAIAKGKEIDDYIRQLANTGIQCNSLLGLKNNLEQLVSNVYIQYLNLIRKAISTYPIGINSVITNEHISYKEIVSCIQDYFFQRPGIFGGITGSVQQKNRINLRHLRFAEIEITQDYNNTLNNVKSIFGSIRDTLKALDEYFIELFNISILNSINTLDITSYSVEYKIAMIVLDILNNIEYGLVQSKQTVFKEIDELFDKKQRVKEGLQKQFSSLMAILDVQELHELYQKLYALAQKLEKAKAKIKELQDRQLKIADKEHSIDLELSTISASKLSNDDIEYMLSNLGNLDILQSVTSDGMKILHAMKSCKIEAHDILSAYVLYHIDNSDDINLRQVIEQYDYITQQINKDEEELRQITSSLIEYKASQNIEESDSILIKEMEKKLKQRKEGMSVRQLISKYYKTLYKIFNIWILTPETISEVLPLQKDDFDVIIFDEASQVFIENALPSLYRAKKAIVAGDDKQLRPTSFFQSSIDLDIEDEDIQEMQGKSLLDQAKDSFSIAHLLFHYRSKFSELIQFSNEAFYNNRLKICPNITSYDSGYKAIEYINVHGEYKNGTNEAEAKKVINIISEIIQSKEYENNPKSIGIITFNVNQKGCIEDMLDDFIQEATSSLQSKFGQLQSMIDNGEDISLFIKNIEDVQGDERDIIIFSTGFGYDTDGKLHNNMGPLRLEGGENRLNVAVSRAKEKEYIVTSLEPEEYKVADSKNIGPRLFVDFIKYARDVSNGVGNKNIESVQNNEYELKFDSPFEEQVYTQLVALGYKVDTQVGVYGYHIDLAIWDSESGKYLAGIECDGATYHSSKYARERDISRQRFLESKGWKILRIWSRNWWKDSRLETARIHRELQNLINGNKDIAQEVSTKSDQKIYTQSDLEEVNDKLDKLAKITAVNTSLKEDTHRKAISKDEKNEKLKNMLRRLLENDYKASYEVSNCLGISIADIVKLDLTGKKIKALKILENSIELKSWYQVLTIAMDYIVTFSMIDNLLEDKTLKEIDLEDVKYREYIIKKLLIEWCNPNWITLNPNSVRRPIQILDTRYYLDVTGSANSICKRTNKILGKQNDIMIIYCE